MSSIEKSPAKRGGDASAQGAFSEAIGGDAGDGELGGDGGHAGSLGLRSIAIGGKGGRGGISKGGRGGDVIATEDNSMVAGGEGGEAAQKDGRGGRGGRNGAKALFEKGLLPQDLYNAVKDYGRGGAGGSTPQYRARKAIVHRFAEELWHISLDALGPSEVDAINKALEEKGHSWRLCITDGECEFLD